ncbi:hypothetical protein diail_3677 [Diaporthe ilicicola]|nr:hypothetical protein diail_3677 [Diaporthe ilicicola]
MSPTGLIGLEEEAEAEAEEEDELGDEEGSREKMAEMVAVVVVGEGKGVVGMTTVTVREVERLAKTATLVEYGLGVGSGGALDDAENNGLLSTGQEPGSPQGSTEQHPTNPLAEQA